MYKIFVYLKDNISIMICTLHVKNQVGFRMSKINDLKENLQAIIIHHHLKRKLATFLSQMNKSCKVNQHL